MISKEKLRSFYSKYFISVINDTRRFSRAIPVRLTAFIDDRDCENRIEIESEPLLTITIPQSKLELLISIENTFFNNIEDVHARRIFEVWMDDHQQEQYLRSLHPGAQAAYEQYQLILSLCREKPKKIKTLD